MLRVESRSDAEYADQWNKYPTKFWLRDAEGRRFFWKTTGSGMMYDNQADIDGAFGKSLVLRRMEPGDIMQVVDGSVKSHWTADFGGMAGDKVTNLGGKVSTERIITADERDFYHEHQTRIADQVRKAQEAATTLAAWAPTGLEQLKADPALAERYDPFVAKLMRTDDGTNPHIEWRLHEVLEDHAETDPKAAAALGYLRSLEARGLGTRNYNNDPEMPSYIPSWFSVENAIAGRSAAMDDAEIEAHAGTYALGRLEAHVSSQRSKPIAMRTLAKADDKKRMQRVRFRHPETGEESDGHMHKIGQKGAQIVGPKGNVHRIEHGHYLHHKGDTVDRKGLIQQAMKHLELGPQSMLGVHAVGVLMAAGGVDHVSKLTTKDVKITKQGVLVLTHKIRIRKPPRLAAMVAHLAQGDGPLLRVGGKPVDHDSLITYAKRFSAKGGGEQELKKASPLAIGLAQPSVAMLTSASWTERGYTCQLRKGPSGIHILTINHPNMGLPLHEVTGNLRKAKAMAKEFISCLVQGKLPSKGVFSPG